MKQFKPQEASFSDVEKKISSSLRDDFQTYQKLYQGDHYRSGNGWVGPKPDVADLAGEPNANEIIQQFTQRVQRQFVSKNVVAEVIGRHVNGVLSRKTDIEVDLPLDSEEAELTPEQESELANYKRWVRQWMQDKNVMQKLRKCLTFALFAESAVLRFFIPSGVVDDDGTIEQPENVEEALEYIYVDALAPDQAMVWQDPDTKKKYGLYTYEDEEENDVLERTFIDDETGGTRVIVESGDSAEEGEPYVLHGRLIHYEITREAIISEQVKQLQDLLNKNLTMWSANLDWSGFTERMILNGMPPGDWELDENTRQMEYNEKGQMRTGPNTTNYVFGQPTFNDEGQVTGMTTPQVQFREPIDVETFNNTLGATYTSILEECKQAHILLNSEATPSGISRREARQDYEDDLKQSKSQVDDAGQWMIETALLLAFDITGQTNEEEFEYDVSFNTILQVGALTAEENDILIKQVENKLISPETAMRRMGIDDIESEMQRIDRVSEHMSEVISVLNEMGVSSGTLAKAITQKLLEDKADFFPEDMQEEAILTEVEESANRQAQQQALMQPFDEGEETE